MRSLLTSRIRSLEPFFFFCLLASLAALLLGPGDTFFLSHFQERDIVRAQKILTGASEHLGPETNLGPRLPGTFYYWLLALPQFAGGSWQSSASLLILLVSVAYAAAATFARQVAGTPWALLLFLTFMFSPPLARELYKHWNPSFGIGIGLFTVLAGEWMAMNQRRAWPWFAWGALISAGLQIHGTYAAYLPAALWTLFHAFRGMPRGALLPGTLLVAGLSLPFLPAWLMLARYPEAAPILVKLAELASYLSSFSFDIAFFPNRVVTYLVPALLPLLIWPGALRPLRSPLESGGVAARMAICAAPAAGFYLWSGYGTRYILAFLIPLTVWAAFTRKRQIAEWNIATALPLAAAVVFLLRIQPLERPLPYSLPEFLLGIPSGLGLALAVLPAAGAALLRRWVLSLALLALGFLPLLPEEREWNGARLPIAEVKELTNEIYRITNWSYEEFRQNSIAISIHKHQGFQLPYPHSSATTPERAERNAPRRPEGLFLVGVPKSKAQKALSFSLNSISKFIKGAEWSRQFPAIEIDEARAYCSRRSTFCLVPFHSGDREFPDLLSNLGTTHIDETWPFKAELENLPSSAPGTYPLSPASALFTWQNCPAPAQDCRTGIAVSARRAGAKVLLTSTVVGRSVSLTMHLLQPSWTEMWQKPYVGVQCGTKQLRRDLIDALGNTLARERQIVAPLRRTLAFDCPEGKVTAVFSGWKAASGNTGRKLVNDITIPASRLTWTLPKGL